MFLGTTWSARRERAGQKHVYFVYDEMKVHQSLPTPKLIMSAYQLCQTMIVNSFRLIRHLAGLLLVILVKAVAEQTVARKNYQ